MDLDTNDTVKTILASIVNDIESDRGRKIAWFEDFTIYNSRAEVSYKYFAQDGQTKIMRTEHIDMKQLLNFILEKDLLHQFWKNK